MMDQLDGYISSDDAFLPNNRISYDGNGENVDSNSFVTVNSSSVQISRDTLQEYKPSNHPVFEYSWNTTQDKISSLPPDDLEYTDENASTLSPNLESPFHYSGGFDECMYVVSKLKEMPKLHRAVWRGDLMKVKSIGNGIRKTVLNTRDHKYRTALHLACAKGENEIISFLCCHLKAIIDVNLQDLNGSTPIHKLIDNGHGHKGSLELLLDCGGNLNMANNFGHTPLHLAAHRGDAETTSFLVFEGAFVHAMDRVGRTPLHLAAQNDQEEVIANLIMYGADINCKDKLGRTPLKIAKEKTMKLMCDLSAEQEQVLMTAADYDAVNQEITSLQPIKEARLKILNKWDMNCDDEDDEDDDDEDDDDDEEDNYGDDETNSCSDDSSNLKQNNSAQKEEEEEEGEEDDFQSASEGHVYDKGSCSEAQLEVAHEYAVSLHSNCFGEDLYLISNVDKSTESNINDAVQYTTWNYNSGYRKKQVKNSSSKESLDRYYSVASVFKCEHFKSMDTQLSYHKDESSDDEAKTTLYCRCYCNNTTGDGSESEPTTSSTTTVMSAANISDTTFLVHSAHIDSSDINSDNAVTAEQSSTIESCSEELFLGEGRKNCQHNKKSLAKESHSGPFLKSSSMSELTSRLHSSAYKNGIPRQSSACAIMTPTKKILLESLSLGTENLVDEKPCQLSEVLLDAQRSDDNATLLQKKPQVLVASQDDLIVQLKLQVQMKNEEIMLQKEKQDKVLSEFQNKVNQKEKECHSLIWQLEENYVTKQVLLQKLEDNIKDKQSLVQELENAYYANQELLLTQKDSDQKKEQMIIEIQKSQVTVNELKQRLMEVNAAKGSLQAELENVISVSNTFNHELLNKLREADSAKSEVLWELKGTVLEKKELAQQLENAERANKELLSKLAFIEIASEGRLQDFEEEKIAKRKMQMEVVYVKDAYGVLLKKLEDSNKDNQKLQREANDAVAINKELFEVIKSAKIATEKLKQKLNDANTTNSELINEVEDAVIVRIKSFQEIADVKSELNELKQWLKNSSKEDEEMQELENASTQVVKKTEVEELNQEIETTNSVNKDEQGMTRAVQTTENLQPDINGVNESGAEVLDCDELTKEISEATNAHFVNRGHTQHAIQRKREVAKLTNRLESMNRDLLEMIKYSGQQEYEIQQLGEEWLKERSAWSGSVVQLRSSLERELKQKELKNEQLQSKSELLSENVNRDESLKSRVRFLESKVFMLEEALNSVQCLARQCNAQSETFRQICIKKEEAIYRIEIDAANKEKTMTEQITGLEKILGICKRRIVDQNEHCTKLVEQIKYTEVQRQLLMCARVRAPETTGHNTIKSLKSIITKTNEVMEENGQYTKTMMDKMWNTLDKISATSNYWKTDAMEAKKQLKLKDETIAAFTEMMKRHSL